MGRIGAKGKKLSVTNQDDDTVSSEKVNIPPQKKRGRPQKSLKDETDVKDVTNTNGKRRKMKAQVKEKVDSVEEENGDSTKSSTEESKNSNGLRQNRNRRKNKPHRAAEAIVECN